MGNTASVVKTELFTLSVMFKTSFLDKMLDTRTSEGKSTKLELPPFSIAKSNVSSSGKPSQSLMPSKAACTVTPFVR